MPEEIKWTVGRIGDAPPLQTSNRIPYVALQRTNDKMTDSQKEGVRVWNLMVKTLQENGLMEDR